MKLLISIFTFLLCLSSIAQHLTSIYDHDGEDFDFITRGLVASGDSLYVLTQNGGDNDLGSHFDASFYIRIHMLRSYNKDRGAISCLMIFLFPIHTISP